MVDVVGIENNPVVSGVNEDDVARALRDKVIELDEEGFSVSKVYGKLRTAVIIIKYFTLGLVILILKLNLINVVYIDFG